jgi:tetratricopeptide (TPR) repeat protein
MKMHLLLVLASIVGTMVSPALAQQNQSDSRVALLIANSNYPDSSTPLATPVKDARSLGDQLKRMGFDVDVKNNLSKADTQKALDSFIAKIRKGSSALFFFSGFGLQVSKQSYLIPTDAQIWTEAEVSRDGTSIDSILTKMNQKGASVKIMIIDASRQNPYERRFRGLSAGLAPLNLPDGALTIYSAATDKVANDSDGTNSVFVTELLQEIRSPGISAEAVFNRTRVGVSRMTNGEQVPWVSSSMLNEFSFNTQPLVASPNRQSEPTKSAQPDPPMKPAYTVPAIDDPEIQKLNIKLQQNPNDAIAFYNRGQLYARNGDFSRAVIDFDQAIRLDPNNAAAFNNRCWARGASGDLDLALKDCNEALRLRPDFADALDSRGLVYLKLNLNGNAVADYDASLRLRPNQASSLFGRGIGKVRIGKNAEGNSDIAAAKAINPGIAEDFAAHGIR